MTPREVLLAAADYLEAKGWKQGGAGVDGGPRCMVGAVCSAADDQYGAIRAHLVLVERFGNPERWNDAEGRTRDEVVAALREAAR